MLPSQPSGEDDLTAYDDVALLQAVAAGNQTALSVLYDRTKALVYGLALRIVHDAAAAQDVTLEVYVQVWRQAARYDPQRGQVVSWLLTMARSRALDSRRAGSQRQQHEQPFEAAQHLPDATRDPVEASAMSEEQRLVQVALQRLAPEQREVIELAYFAGLSHRDIAMRLGQPLGTIKTRIRLGMSHLRAYLSPAIRGEQPWTIAP